MISLRTFIQRLIHYIKLWNINAEYCQLDMDMMCTTMTYEEYCEEQKTIDIKYDKLQLL